MCGSLSSSFNSEMCRQARNDSLSSKIASLRDDLDKEKKQLEEELEEVLEEVNLLEEQDKRLLETIQLLTQEKHTVEGELNSTREELER